MRPLRLEIEGFTAFRDRLELDLTSLDLFAITGQTGAGKSSIIDSICYALYGRVPRVGAQLGECISQGLNRMQVTLDFLAGSDRWRVFRETRRTGQPNVRLERFLDEGWQATVHGVTAVNQRIEAIVGLSYDAFTRSVLLPQGEFQEFLAGSPVKRREVLQFLLRLDMYERMRSRAGEMARAHKARIDERESTLGSLLSHATPDNLKRHEGDLEVARAEAEGLEGRLARWTEAVEVARAFRAAADAACEAKLRLHELTGDLERSEALTEQGSAAIEELESKLRDTEEALAANSYDEDALTSLTLAGNLALELDKAQRRLEEARGAAAAKQEALALAEEGLTAAEAAQAMAESRHDAAEHAHVEAQRADYAGALQAGMKAGDTCPVCGGKVTSLPAAAGGDLARASKEAREAAAAREEARGAWNRANAQRAEAEAEARAAAASIEEISAAIEHARAQVVDALPAVEDRSVANIRLLYDAQKEARAEKHRLSGERDDLRTTLDDARGTLAEATASLAAQRKLIEAQRESAAASSAAEARERQNLEAAAEHPDLAPLAEALAAGSDVLKVAQTQMRTVAERRDVVLGEIGSLVQLVDRMKDDIEKAQQMRLEIGAERKLHGVAHDLSQMLGASRFQAFAQAEALRLLADEGSRRLLTLSSGRYRLDIDTKGQDFEAIDQWNADEKRSVRTLSGGETFLASLALSLALAETLPGLAPDRRVTLDAIFLDEGFGSLDPEALDRAAEALDSLRDGARMVCVVTHLQELAQRLPARIVVEKSETGSRAAIAAG